MSLGVCIWTAVTLVAGAAQEPLARDRLREVYLTVVRADLYGAGGGVDEARSLYQKANGLLLQLGTDYPGWQAETLTRQQLYVQARLADLESAPPATLEGPDGAGSGPAEARAPVDSTAALAGIATNEMPAAAIESQDRGAEKANGLVLKSLQGRAKRLEQEKAALERRLAEADRENEALRARLAQLGTLLVPEGTVASAEGGGQRLYLNAIREEARRLLQQGKVKDSEALLDEGRVLAPGDLQMALLLGMIHCQAGEYAQAIAVLEPQSRKPGAPADMLMTIGVAYMGLGNLGAARASTEEAIKANPRLSDAHYNMAQILLKLDPPQPEAAKRAYERSLELGGRRDPEVEDAIRRALVLKKAAEMPKEKKDDKAATTTSTTPTKK